VGEEASIFVENGLASVGEEDVARLRRLFLERGSPGSVDPDRSIYRVTTDYFGPTPRAPNGSSHTVLLVADLPPFRNTVLDGYFNPYDQVTEEEAARDGQHSNEANILYLNGTGPSPVASEYMQGVLSHEFQHLTHHGQDPEEESWLNEMVSQASMLANGYHTDMGHVARFARHPERPLVSQTYVDYGAELLFAAYLLERYGKGFFQELTRAPEHGIASIDATLERLGRPERFADLYADWLVANYADSQGAIRPGVHYATLDLPPMAEAAVLAGAPAEAAGTVAPTAARYVRLETAEPLEVRVEGGPGLVVRAFRPGRPDPEVRSLVPGADPVLLPAGPWVVALGSLGQEETPYRLATSAPGPRSTGSGA
jgi:hypothetical protein